MAGVSRNRVAGGYSKDAAGGNLDHARLQEIIAPSIQ